jgi:NADPH:quinone reductase-like Zn-dependent oxidoreductase
MGLVPGDQHLLGLEGADFIRRICRKLGPFPLKIGDRVLVSRKGSFANRVQAPIEAVHPLPESMYFEVKACLTSTKYATLTALIGSIHVDCCLSCVSTWSC